MPERVIDHQSGILPDTSSSTEPKKTDLRTLLNHLPQPLRSVLMRGTLIASVLMPGAALASTAKADSQLSVALNGTGVPDSSMILRSHPELNCYSGSRMDFYVSGGTPGATLTEKQTTQQDSTDCNGNKLPPTTTSFSPTTFDSNGNAYYAAPVTAWGPYMVCFDDMSSKQESCLNFVLTPHSDLTANPNLSPRPIVAPLDAVPAAPVNAPASPDTSVNTAPQTNQITSSPDSNANNSVNTSPQTNPTLTTPDTKINNSPTVSSPKPSVNNPVISPSPTVNNPQLIDFAPDEAVKMNKAIDTIKQVAPGKPVISQQLIDILRKNGINIDFDRLNNSSAPLSEVIQRVVVHRSHEPGTKNCTQACSNPGTNDITFKDLDFNANGNPLDIQQMQITTDAYKEYVTNEYARVYPGLPGNLGDVLPVCALENFDQAANFNSQVSIDDQICKTASIS